MQKKYKGKIEKNEKRLSPENQINETKNCRNLNKCKLIDKSVKRYRVKTCHSESFLIIFLIS